MSLRAFKCISCVLAWSFLFLSGITVLAKEYEILHVFDQDESGNSEGTSVIIDGGYNDFIYEGLKCRLTFKENFPYDKDTLKINFDVELGEITEVDGYTSVCRLKFIDKEFGDLFFPYASVKASVMDVPLDVVYLEAGDALKHKNYIKAKIYFEKFLELSPDPDSTAILKAIEKCDKEIKNQKVSRRKKRTEEKNIHVLQELGFHFYYNKNSEAANYYFNKILQIDSKNHFAEELIKIVNDPGIQEEIANVDSVTNLEIFPEMIFFAEPTYPREAELYGQVGTVWIRVLINKKGKVIDAHIERSSGYKTLDNAALAAAYQNKFKPGISKGLPTACWVVYKVDFKL